MCLARRPNVTALALAQSARLEQNEVSEICGTCHSPVFECRSRAHVHHQLAARGEGRDGSDTETSYWRTAPSRPPNTTPSKLWPPWISCLRQAVLGTRLRLVSR